jgi:hypothetical protein
MKVLMGTAALVVILTCGYFFYDDRKSKIAATASERESIEMAEHLRCRESLREAKELLERVNIWEGKTYEERLAAISNSNDPTIKKYAATITLMFESSWERCGPI